MAKNEEAPRLGDLIRKYFWNKFGIWGLVVLALLGLVVYVWFNWHDVKTAPGVSEVVKSLERDAIPIADPKRFSVAVADLEGESEHGETKQLIVRLLRDADGVQVLSLPHTISVTGTVPEEQEREGHQQAREYLKESNAHVLIWGSVLRYGGESKPDLYLTIAADRIERSKQYTVEIGTEYRLPQAFWQDLSSVLSLVIASEVAQFQISQGHHVADRLVPFIARVQNLIEARPSSSWDADSLAATRVILADALFTAGMQTGNNRFLEDAVTTYRLVLQQRTRERGPLKWAAIQNNLGNTLFILGDRQSDKVRLEEAVAAFRLG